MYYVFHLVQNYIIIAQLINFFIMFKYVHFGVVDHHEGTQIKSVRAIFFH
jgi:hypothetical protein